jgi:hypothetical protein
MTGDTVSELATNERLAAHIVSPAELHRQLFLAGRKDQRSAAKPRVFSSYGHQKEGL